MRTIIVEDEIRAISALKAEINYHCPQLEIVGEARSIKEAVEKVNILKPALVFLDIQLSDGLGFEILSVLKSQSFKVIFTTAYSEYAIQAIKFSALDYLLKPIDSAELVLSVRKAYDHITVETLRDQLAVLEQQISGKTEKEEKRIVLKDVDKTYFVKLNDILYCEAVGAYTKFVLTTSEPILVSRNLRSYEELLTPAGFIRTHHSCLVNSSKIKVYDRKTDGGSLILEGGLTLPVSQRKKDYVIRFLENR